jgi:hypothetical protein
MGRLSLVVGCPYAATDDHSNITLVVFGSLLLLVATLGIVLAATLRHSRQRGEPGDCVSLLLAERIARTSRRRAAHACIVWLAAIAGAYALEQPLLVAPMIVFASIPLWTLIAAMHVLHLLDEPDAHAEIRESSVIVGCAKGAARLATSRRVIAEARCNAVPLATLRTSVHK